MNNGNDEQCPIEFCPRFRPDVEAVARRLQEIAVSGAVATQVVLNITPEGRYNPREVKILVKNSLLTSI